MWIAAADPSEAAERFARFTGRPFGRDGETATITLDRGAVRIATPEHLERQLAVRPGPPVPYLAAYELEVASLAPLCKLLERSELPGITLSQGIGVPLPPAVGGTIFFRQSSG